MAKQKAVVTGGAGFIGTHMEKALLDEGFEVHVVDNLVAGKRENVPAGATLHEVDIRETDKLREIFTDAAFVFHLAALPRVQFSIEHPQETHDVNVNGTLSVFTAAKDAKVGRLVYAASSSAYGDQDKMPLREDMPANPKSPYALHKYVGELYAKMFSEIYGLPTVCLRYFNVYGPGASAEGAYALVIARFLKLRQENQPMTITGDGTQTRDFTHVRDIVRANLLAAKSDKVGKGEVINIGGGKNASVNRVAELIGGPTVHVPPRLEPHDTLADTSRAKSLLNWEPTVTLEDGIAELKKLRGLA